MAKCCAVTNCEASNKDFGTILFCFPQAEDLRRQWIKALGKPDSWTVPELAFVCWSHFESKDILQDGTSFRRSADAVPSQYLNAELFAPDSDYFCRFCARKLFSDLMGTNISDMHRSEDARKFLDLLMPVGNEQGLSNLACDACMMQIKLTMKFIRNCAKATRELEHIVSQRAMKPKAKPEVKTEMEEFGEIPVESIEPEVKVEVASLGGMSDRDDDFSDAEDDIPLAVKFKQELADNELKCSYCSFSCTRRIQLASHMKKHRDLLPTKTYSCVHCDFTCTKRVELESHRKIHKKKKQAGKQVQEDPSKDDIVKDGEDQDPQSHKTSQSDDSSEGNNSSEMLQCSECPYTCTRMIQLASHKKKHNGYKERKPPKKYEKKKPKEIYECEFCDFKCKQLRQMAGHRAFHSDLIRKSKPSGKERDHMCSICGKILATRGSFFVHMKYHNDERNYPCTMCDKKFYSKRDVSMHIESLHQKKIFECEICGVKCTWKNALNKHMRKHNENSYKHECSYCGKKFMAANELRLHVWRHTGQQLTCDICGAGYRFNFLLTQHKIRAHGIQIEGVKLYNRFRKDRSAGSKRTSSDADSTPALEASSNTASAMPSMQHQPLPLTGHRPPVEESSSSSYSSDMPANYQQPTATGGPHLPVPFHPLGSLVGHPGTSQNSIFSQVSNNY